MARIRKGCAYRRVERAYTRISKFREKSFIRITPTRRIVRFVMGDPNKKFEYALDLISKNDLQLRDNSIESARQSANRLLEKTLGTSYRMQIRVFPHHILRENPLAAGAGADRMSTGMSHSFGKPIGVAARVHQGQKIMTLMVDKVNLEIAKKALKRGASKLSCSCQISISKIS